MANDGAVARLSGRFPPGTKVGLYRGRVDGVLRDESLRGAFKTATVDPLGYVEFKGLDDDERLFIAGVVEEQGPGEREPRNEWRSVAIHASIPQEPVKRQSEKQIREALGSTLSAHEQEPDRTKVGARNSTARSTTSQGAPFAYEQAGKPTEGGPPQHPSPRLRQEDARDVEQRTATITGAAYPVDPDEQVPAPKQDGAVKLEQRVATGVGTLYPVPEGEVPAGVPQEESVGRDQRIATEVGTQYPLPEGDAVDHTRSRDSSLAKVTGGNTPPVKRAKSQKSRRRSAKKGTAQKRGQSSRTEAQKAARRERDRARRAQRKGK